MAENQLVEEWLRVARTSDLTTGQFAATMALAEGVKWIGELLAELVQMVKESEGGNNVSPLPCNEMGGGSAGLDTAGDCVMHCDKPDRHDGPHSYEEGDNG